MHPVKIIKITLSQMALRYFRGGGGGRTVPFLYLYLYTTIEMAEFGLP